MNVASAGLKPMSLSRRKMGTQSLVKVAQQYAAGWKIKSSNRLSFMLSTKNPNVLLLSSISKQNTLGSVRTFYWHVGKSMNGELTSILLRAFPCIDDLVRLANTPGSRHIPAVVVRKRFSCDIRRACHPDVSTLLVSGISEGDHSYLPSGYKP